MKKQLYIILLGLSILSISFMRAQESSDVVDPASQYFKSTTEQKSSPLYIPGVNKKDVFWSKTVMEVVDLNEKLNFPLYYPIDTLRVESYRRSLYDVLINKIKTGEIKSVYTDAYILEKRTLEDLKASLVKVDTTDLGLEQYNANEPVSEQYITRRTITAADIKQYILRGTWYFDKRLGELKYRLLAFAPMAPDVNFIDSGEDPYQNLIPLFWVWYPEARDILHEAKVYNPNNDFNPNSFGDIFEARYFNSLIISEDNIYDNRQIKDYLKNNSLYQLLESNRIREWIRNKEADMWNY